MVISLLLEYSVLYSIVFFEFRLVCKTLNVSNIEVSILNLASFKRTLYNKLYTNTSFLFSLFL